MGIQKDAGELLFFLYKKYVSEDWEGFETESLWNYIEWNKYRTQLALDFLIDEDMIKIKPILSPGAAVKRVAENNLIKRITPKGIKTIENQKEFKKLFGFEVNLGLVKLSWGTQER